MIIRFTYEMITEESSEHGDTADNGFFDPERDIYQSIVNRSNEFVQSMQVDYRYGLADALRAARAKGISMPSCYPFNADDSNMWWSSVDAEEDYSTGESYYYSLHISGITPSTRGRINTALNVA